MKDELDELYEKILDSRDWGIDDLDRLIDLEMNKFNQVVDEANILIE